MKYAEQLRAATDELVKLKQWRPVLLKIQQELQKLIDLLPRRRNLIEHHQYIELMAALKVVENGHTFDGLSNFPNEAVHPLIECIGRRPGLIETNEKIAQLETDCKTLRAYEKRWPTPDTTRKFRYTGKPDKTQIDGRFVEPGEILALTETRALALADRVEACD